jgi:hypothetical protein
VDSGARTTGIRLATLQGSRVTKVKSVHAKPHLTGASHTIKPGENSLKISILL